MIIERTCYMNWLAEMTQCEEQVRKEEAEMTAEERITRDQKRAEEFDRLCSVLDAREVNTYYVPNPIRKLFFRRLCEKLAVYAEQRAADLFIETNEKRGIVRLSFGQLILDGLYPAWHNRLWKQLIKHADDVWMDPVEKHGKPAIQCTFVFDFMWAVEKDLDRCMMVLGVGRTAEYD